MMRIEGHAPAKLNLTLEVLGRRADGYHEVASVMHTLSLCDTLTLELPSPERLNPALGEIHIVEASDTNRAAKVRECTGLESPRTPTLSPLDKGGEGREWGDSTRAEVSGLWLCDWYDSPPLREAIPTDSRNLVWQAVERFCEMLNMPPSVRFPPLREGNHPPSVPPASRGNLKEGVQASWRAVLTKRIPPQAGLGGGSSDAACALRLLNQWAARYERALSDDALHTLASELGADVAFFLNGGCALATGKGERLQPLPTLPPFWWVLAKPYGVGVPTGWAYAQLGRGAVQPERTSQPHRTPPAPAADHSHAPRPRPAAAQRLRRADPASHPRAGGAAHASGTGRRTARHPVRQRRSASRPVRIRRPRQNPRKCANPTELLGSSGAELLIFREK
jgi:4-diphosphocytidyl-2C-methyl-D-erythritol kinase